MMMQLGKIEVEEERAIFNQSKKVKIIKRGKFNANNNLWQMIK